MRSIFSSTSSMVGSKTPMNRSVSSQGKNSTRPLSATSKGSVEGELGRHRRAAGTPLAYCPPTPTPSGSSTTASLPRITHSSVANHADHDVDSAQNEAYFTKTDASKKKTGDRRLPSQPRASLR